MTRLWRIAGWLALLAPFAAAAEQSGTALSLGGGHEPLDVTADDGIELQQSNKLYVARGNVVLKRGDRTLTSDTVVAYYRNLPNSTQTEIWRVVADGHVVVSTPTQKVQGGHGVYDLDSKLLVMTGGQLKMTTPLDLVTARDSLEWYDDKRLAVARGNAVGKRADRQIRADVLTAQLEGKPGEASHIGRVDATGHVLVSRPDQIGMGDKGIYNVDQGIVTLAGHVTLTRGDNTAVGSYGVVDLKNGVSRLLAGPSTGTDEAAGRVHALIVPRQNTADGAQNPETAAGKPARVEP